MRNFALFFIITGLIILSSCEKDEESESFSLLTGPTWESDSLLVNGMDAGGPAGILSNFRGDAKFNTDGTGRFGRYTGTWNFAFNETQLVISTDSLPFPLSARIAELTKSSLKITTRFPNPAMLPATLDVRMTFKAK